MAKKNVTLTVDDIASSLKDVDAMNQSVTETIKALAFAAQKLLSLDATTLIAVNTMLQNIYDLADSHENDVNCIAEACGANYIDESGVVSRLWAEHYKLHGSSAAS